VARAVNTVSLTKSRYVVDTEEWKVEPVTPEESSPAELLATGLSAARLGDREALRAAEAELRRRVEGGQGGYTEVMSKQVSALHHAAMGHADVATGLMDEAVAIVEAMAPPRGSANPIKPVHELYGELLLELDRPEAAIEMFETSLLRMPNRPRSLLGLARANVAVGNEADAAEAYRKLAAVWAGRDSFEGYQEAQRFLRQTTH
jgi:tetratricopeptide (TPR) repeat protein